ncbi:MAG: DegV family protein [Oscillospiraceae bacterium]|nr:DegV family protein [Oscillospiraceae bacterium]
MDYLKKGGRCSAIVALGANLMKLRPEIVVQNGKMSVGKKYRGSMERSVSDYIRGRLEGRTDLDLSRIFITHSGVPDEILTMAVDLVKSLQPFEEVLTSRAGCTITSHCGPGTLGVLFFKK